MDDNYGVLIFEPEDYKESACQKDFAVTKELFDNGLTALGKEFLLARPSREKVLPQLLTEIQRVCRKFQNLISTSTQLQPESFSVVETYTSDGDRYFHEIDSLKWHKRLIRYSPDEC